VESNCSDSGAAECCCLDSDFQALWSPGLNSDSASDWYSVALGSYSGSDSEWCSESLY